MGTQGQAKRGDGHGVLALVSLPAMQGQRHIGSDACQGTGWIEARTYDAQNVDGTGIVTAAEIPARVQGDLTRYIRLALESRKRVE